MAALFGGADAAGPTSAGATIEILKGQGFVAVRVLAERDGLRFVEAIKKEQLSSVVPRPATAESGHST